MSPFFPPPTLLGRRSHSLGTHGWFELILSQVTEEIAEDLTALAGLGAEQQKVRVDQLHNAVAIIFVALVSPELPTVYPISYLTAASASHSQEDAVEMSPPLYIEKAAAMNLTAKASELPVGCRHCSVLTTAIQVKLLHSRFFFFFFTIIIILYSGIQFCVYFSGSAGILDLCE